MLFGVAAAMAAVASLLPWVKAPGVLERDQIEAAEEVLGGTRQRVGPADFFWLDPAQLGSAMDDPLAGANVWQLAWASAAAHGKGRVSGPAYGAALVTRPLPRAGLALAAAVAIVFFLAMAGARMPSRGFGALLCGLALLLVYVLIRWRIVATEGARAVADVEMGLGAWLTALAALLAAVTYFLREAFPKVKWF